jgi:hypothetical protein
MGIIPGLHLFGNKVSKDARPSFFRSRRKVAGRHCENFATFT